jgi:ankyrin repeat protein
MSNDNEEVILTGRDKIFMAIDAADPERLVVALEEDNSLASCKSDDGLSAVLFTIYIRQPELTEILLRYDPEMSIFELAGLGRIGELASLLLTEKGLVNSMSSDGFSALHLSCFFGNLEAASFLIEQGANVNIRASNSSELTPLHSASAGKHDAILARLIEGGTDVNMQQSGGYTALMSSANLGAEENIDALLNAGADVNIMSDDGFKASSFAMNGGFTKLSERLKSLEE